MVNDWFTAKSVSRLNGKSKFVPYGIADRRAALVASLWPSRQDQR